MYLRKGRLQRANVIKLMYEPSYKIYSKDEWL